MSIAVGKLGIVRVTGADMADLRSRRWRLDRGICHTCGIATFYWPRFDGDPQAYDMAHIVSRGAGGSDVIENVRTECHSCHMREHNGGK
jgi:5-methylcytosine-specific restriction endonuclease McrA